MSAADFGLGHAALSTLPGLLVAEFRRDLIMFRSIRVAASPDRNERLEKGLSMRFWGRELQAPLYRLIFGLILAALLNGCDSDSEENPTDVANVAPVAAIPTQIDPLIRTHIEPHLVRANLNPAEVDARGTLGLCYEANSLWNEAKNEYLVCLELDPDNPEWRHRLGVVYYNLGLLAQALPAFESNTQRFPEFAPSWHRIATIHVGRGEYAKARSATERCLELIPGDSHASVTLAECELRDNQTESAIRRLEKLLERSQNPHVRYVLGRAYQQAGRPREDFAELLEQGQNARPTYVRSPLGIKADQHRSSVSDYVSQAIYSIQLAQQRNDPEQVKRAIRLLEIAEQYHPNKTEVLSSLAVAYNLNGEPERAVDTIDRAIELDPKQFRYYVNKVDILVKEQRLAEARKAAILAVEYGPEEWQAHFSKARVAITRGDLGEAASSIESARRLTSPKAALELARFEVAMLRKNYPVAVESVRLAAEIDPGNIQAWVNLCVTEARFGNFEAADRAIARALKISPNHPRVKQALNALERAKQGAKQ